MTNGMYVSPKRIVRNGFLVAYKGEVMGLDEAARRGLVADEPDQPKKPARRQTRSRTKK